MFDAVKSPLVYSYDYHVWDLQVLYKAIKETATGKNVSIEDASRWCSWARRTNVHLASIVFTKKAKFRGFRYPRWVGDKYQLSQFLQKLWTKYADVVNLLQRQIDKKNMTGRSLTAMDDCDDEEDRRGMAGCSSTDMENCEDEDSGGVVIENDNLTDITNTNPQELLAYKQELRNDVKDLVSMAQAGIELPRDVTDLLARELLACSMKLGKRPRSVIDVPANVSNKISRSKSPEAERKISNSSKRLKEAVGVTVKMSPASEWLYAKQVTDQPFVTKIGFTRHPRTRIRAGNTDSMTPWKYIRLLKVKNGRQLESWILQRLRAEGRLCGDHLREMFFLDTESALKIFDHISQYVSQDGTVNFLSLQMPSTLLGSLTPRPPFVVVPATLKNHENPVGGED
jgi:hypothetical protein